MPHLDQIEVWSMLIHKMGGGGSLQSHADLT